jgi:hypothetical protein
MSAPHTRHSREGGNPFFLSSILHSRRQRQWIPAFAGMTMKDVSRG